MSSGRTSLTSACLRHTCAMTLPVDLELMNELRRQKLRLDEISF
jgi:hypothetical protein